MTAIRFCHQVQKSVFPFLGAALLYKAWVRVASKREGANPGSPQLGDCKQSPQTPLRHFTKSDSKSNLEILGRRPLLIMNQKFALWLLFCFFTLVCPKILDPRDVDAPFLSCYDYIICGVFSCIAETQKSSSFTDHDAGGGVSGLVLANRLTEDPNGLLPKSFLPKRLLTSSSYGPGPRSRQPASSARPTTLSPTNNSPAITTKTSFCIPSKTGMV